MHVRKRVQPPLGLEHVEHHYCYFNIEMILSQEKGFHKRYSYKSAPPSEQDKNKETDIVDSYLATTVGCYYTINILENHTHLNYPPLCWDYASCIPTVAKMMQI